MVSLTQESAIDVVSRPAVKLLARTGSRIAYGITAGLTGYVAVIAAGAIPLAAGSGAKALCGFLGSAAAAGTFHAIRKGFFP